MKKKKLWKKLLWGFGGFFTLLIITLIVLPFVIDLNKYTDQIEALVEQQVKADLEIGGIYLSTWPYLGVRIENVALKSLPAPQSAFNGGEIVSFGKADFKISMRSLLKGKLVMLFQLNEPKINVVTNPAKVMNATEILPEAKTPPPEAAPVDLGAVAANPWLKRVLIEEVRIKDGFIKMTDQSVAGAQPTTLEKFNFAIEDIQLSDPAEPMRLFFSAVAMKMPVELKTGIWLDLAKQTLRLGEGKLNAGPAALGFEIKAENFMKPDLSAEANLFGNVSLHQPEQKIDLNKMNLTVTAKGSGPNMTVTGNFKADQLKFNEYLMTNLQSTFSYGGNAAALQNFSAEMFDGTLQTSGRVTLEKLMGYDLALNIENINIAKLTEVASGRGFFKLHVAGKGVDQKSINENLSGEGEIKLADGKMNGFNLAQQVFGAKVAGLIQNSLAGKSGVVTLPGQQEQGQSFKQVILPIKIENGKLIVNQMQIDMDGYRGAMEGAIAFDMTADLHGKFFLSPEHTAQLITDEKIRSYMTDPEGQLVIPFKITGPLKSPSVTPDEGYISELALNAAKKMVTDEAKQKAQELAREKVIPKAQEGIQQAAPAVEQKAKDVLKSIF